MLKFKIKLSIFYLIFYFNWVYMAFINRQINKNWCTCSKQSIISSTFLSFGVSNIQEQARNAPFLKKIYSHCPLLSMHLFPVWTSTVLFSFLITYHGGEQHGLIFWTGNFIYGNVIFIDISWQTFLSVCHPSNDLVGVQGYEYLTRTIRFRTGSLWSKHIY